MGHSRALFLYHLVLSQLIQCARGIFPLSILLDEIHSASSLLFLCLFILYGPLPGRQKSNEPGHGPFLPRVLSRAFF